MPHVRPSVRAALAALVMTLAAAACDSRITGPDVCETLVVVQPVGLSPLPTDGQTMIIAPKSGYAASTSESPDYAISWIKLAPDASFPVRAGTIKDPFTVWPAEATGASELVPSAVTQILASSDRGPGLLIDGHRLLLSGQSAQDVFVPTGNNLDPFALFASNLGTRTLVAVVRTHIEPTTASAEYAISSFDGTTRFEEIVPPGCTSAVLAAAAPRPVDAGRSGFLVGLAFPADPLQACTQSAPSTTVAVERYLIPANRKEALDHASAARIDAGAQLDGLAMVEASFGAWVVMGTYEEVGRPLRAVRLDADGVVKGEPVLVTLTRRGSDPSHFAVSRVGDDLAVAWITDDPNRTVIQIQLVHPDGTFGATQQIVVAEDEPLFLNAIHVVGSPDRRGLLLDWETFSGAPQPVGLARLDCVAR